MHFQMPGLAQFYKATITEIHGVQAYIYHFRYVMGLFQESFRSSSNFVFIST